MSLNRIKKLFVVGILLGSSVLSFAASANLKVDVRIRPTINIPAHVAPDAPQALTIAYRPPKQLHQLIESKPLAQSVWHDLKEQTALESGEQEPVKEAVLETETVVLP